MNGGDEKLERPTLIGSARTVVWDRSCGGTRRYGDYACEEGEDGGSKIHYVFPERWWDDS